MCGRINKKFFLLLGILVSFSSFVSNRCKGESMDNQTESLQFDEVVKQMVPLPLSSPQFIKARDGVQLAYYEFLPSTNPKASLVFYHGAGMWSNRLYQQMAYVLAHSSSVAVYLADLRGHGNSGGPRGDAPSASHVWQDIDDIVNLVRQKNRTVPLFLGGHSAGAGVILNYSDWKPVNFVEGYFFVAPYFGEKSGTIRPDQKFVKKVRLWALLGNIFSGGLLFKHTKAVYFNYPERILRQDPAIVTSYTTMMTFATSPYDAHDLLRKLNKPCAIFIGDNDEQFIPEKIVACKNYLQKDILDSSVIQLIAHATHLSILWQAPDFLSHAIEKYILLKK